MCLVVFSLIIFVVGGGKEISVVAAVFTGWVSASFGGTWLDGGQTICR